MDYDEEEISDLMDGLFTEIGLTDEVLDRFMNHLLPIVEDPSLESRLMAISDRMNQLEYFETIDELSAEQVAELSFPVKRIIPFYPVTEIQFSEI
ncbi:processed acidic surface protein [Bacillus sp. ISL-57]|uniref:processed acidic surface protein n=1 Tax=Bacillus sp. ISL-57 TaxID=2819135 RepID=UPI0020364647|nr:processed acidic surface protein [Bacillus sp. ISL-57]